VFESAAMPLRSLLVGAVTAAALTATSAPALAAPPLNDNYLGSTALNAKGSPLAPTLMDSVDTTDATTQADLFNPGPDGQPLGGAGPENTQCNGTAFGKTVWWDFHPKVNGGVEIKTSGFDNVITVYQWDDRTSQIVRPVQCQDLSSGPSEDMVLTDEVKAGKAYTVQVGGVSGPGGLIAGGPLSFELDYFADTDGDGVYDAIPDHCKRTPGPDRFGGCPPELKSVVVPSFNYDTIGTSIRIHTLLLAHVPKGAKVQARCGGCPTVTATARHSTVEFKRLEGRVVRKGAKIQLRATLGRTGSGNYKFGATGVLITWPVTSGAIGLKRTQCLQVGTFKTEKCR
jgi:hypothetical protein